MGLRGPLRGRKLLLRMLHALWRLAPTAGGGGLSSSRFTYCFTSVSVLPGSKTYGSEGMPLVSWMPSWLAVH